jgi:hypothetical protein
MSLFSTENSRSGVGDDFIAYLQRKTGAAPVTVMTAWTTVPAAKPKAAPCKQAARVEHKQPGPVTVTCCDCGATFAYTYTMGPVRTLCDACLRLRERTRRAISNRKAGHKPRHTLTRTCSGCGVEFSFEVTGGHGQMRRYCSDYCGWKARHRKTQVDIT